MDHLKKKKDNELESINLDTEWILILKQSLFTHLKELDITGWRKI